MYTKDECGCHIDYYEGFKDKTDQIVYCPLHRSAPDLYEACKVTLNQIWAWEREWPQKAHWYASTKAMLEQAIAKVES